MKKKINLEVVFTEGAEERIAKWAVDLYTKVKAKDMKEDGGYYEKV